MNYQFTRTEKHNVINNVFLPSNKPNEDVCKACFFYIDFRLAKAIFYCSRYKVKTFLNSISIDVFKSRLATLSLKWMTQEHGWKHFESCFHRNFANLDNVFNNTICYLLWRVASVFTSFGRVCADFKFYVWLTF